MEVNDSLDWGEWSTWVEVSGQHRAPGPSILVKVHSTYWIGRCVEARDHLDCSKEKTVFCPCWIWSHNSSCVCLAHSHRSTDLRCPGSLLQTSFVLSYVATGVSTYLINLYLRFLRAYLCNSAIVKVSLKAFSYFRRWYDYILLNCIAAYTNNSCHNSDNFLSSDEFLYFLLIKSVSFFMSSCHSCFKLEILFNPLNTKSRLLCLKTQFVPRSKHFSSRL